MKTLHNFLVNNRVNNTDKDIHTIKDLYNLFAEKTLTRTIRLHAVDKNSDEYKTYKTYGLPCVQLFGLTDIKFDAAYETNEDGIISLYILDSEHMPDCYFTINGDNFIVSINDLGRVKVKDILKQKCKEFGFVKDPDNTESVYKQYILEM